MAGSRPRELGLRDARGWAHHLQPLRRAGTPGPARAGPGGAEAVLMPAVRSLRCVPGFEEGTHVALCVAVQGAPPVEASVHGRLTAGRPRGRLSPGPLRCPRGVV